MIENIITHWGIEISLLLRLIAGIVILFFFLPLQLKQAEVKNGLSKLRYQLLASGIILFLSDIISIIFLFDLYFKREIRIYINSGLQITDAFVWLIISILFYNIYHNQYTKENIEHHEMIDRLEKEL